MDPEHQEQHEHNATDGEQLGDQGYGDHAHEETQAHHHDAHQHDGETHSDIAATYQFVCDAPDQLTRLTLGLFDAFAGMEAIKVQYVIESKPLAFHQGAAELTAKNPVVQFRGASSR